MPEAEGGKEQAHVAEGEEEEEQAHATGFSSPFDVGTAPFLRFRRAFLVLFSLASGEQLARPSDLLPLSSRRASPNRAVLVVVVQWLKGSIPCSGKMSSCGVGLAGSRWPRALPLPLQLRCSPVPFLASSLTKCKFWG